MAIRFDLIRETLATLPSDHDASGEHLPRVEEVFAPAQHANALDPNTPIVVGSRGAGKSFWAGVLEQSATRAFAAQAYPNLGLDKLIVAPGYTGFAKQNVVSARMIEKLVPDPGSEGEAVDLWTAVIVRAGRQGLGESGANDRTLRETVEELEDPELAERELKRLDKQYSLKGKTLLVTFDALDTWTKSWKRSALLTDALFEVVWSLRSKKAIRAKIFIRPEQLNDDSLSFVELPKLRSGRVHLEWDQVDLYGMLFSRLYSELELPGRRAFTALIKQAGYSVSKAVVAARSSPIFDDSDAQKALMDLFAGRFMGRGNKKGGTYDWPYNHLADARGEVTPRSFVSLFVEAAKYSPSPKAQVVNWEGIRSGLREASKIRVDQLGVEYKWIKRALAPLAGVIVPCAPEVIHEKWRASKTIEAIFQASDDQDSGFMPPFARRPKRKIDDDLAALVLAMERIGVIALRSDGRLDMPDLFRVAAQMLKKGGVAPQAR